MLSIHIVTCQSRANASLIRSIHANTFTPFQRAFTPFTRTVAMNSSERSQDLNVCHFFANFWPVSGVGCLSVLQRVKVVRNFWWLFPRNQQNEAPPQFTLSFTNLEVSNHDSRFTDDSNRNRSAATWNRTNRILWTSPETYAKRISERDQTAAA